MSDYPKTNILAPQANALDLALVPIPQAPQDVAVDASNTTANSEQEPASEFDIDALKKQSGPKLKPNQRDQVLTLLAQGVSQVEIARMMGVRQSAIAYIKARYTPTVEAARALIHARAQNVASHWLKAVPIAAKKGDHRPARDWLTAAGVVAPEQQQGAHITIQVGTGTSVTVDDLDPFAQAKVITNEK